LLFVCEREREKATSQIKWTLWFLNDILLDSIKSCSTFGFSIFI